MIFHILSYAEGGALGRLSALGELERGAPGTQWNWGGELRCPLQALELQTLELQTLELQTLEDNGRIIVG